MTFFIVKKALSLNSDVYAPGYLYIDADVYVNEITYTFEVFSLKMVLFLAYM